MMITECIAILAISLCLIVVFIRAGHADYAASVTPILIVPVAHLISIPLGGWMNGFFSGLAAESVMICADITAVVISCLMVMAFSSKIKSKKNKRLYVSLLGGYNIILTCAFVHQILAGL